MTTTGREVARAQLRPNSGPQAEPAPAGPAWHQQAVLSDSDVEPSRGLAAARRRADLTQSQLGDRAGLTQSVISAYEAGRRQPSLSTLSALIAATGHELHLQLRRTPGRLDAPIGPIGKRVRQNRRWLLDTAAAHAIRNIAVFAASQQRLSDITAAIAAIRAHLEGGDLSDGLIFDAVRIKLLEIGEAVKSLPVEVTSAEPRIPWTHIARMRDHLAHRCFDTSHAIVAATPEHHLPGLADAGAQLGTLESRFLRSKA